MSNRSAILLALVIALAIGIDQLWYSGQYALFLIRKLADLIEYLAFWR